MEAVKTLTGSEMKWASALSGDHLVSEKHALDFKQALSECTESIRFQLSGQTPDIAILFVSPHFRNHLDKVPALMRTLLEPGAFIGCTAGGLIGGGREVEQKQAIAIVGAVLPDVDVKTFHLTDDLMPDADAGPNAWENLVGVPNSKEPNFILLPDPFSFRIDSLVEGLDYAFPKAIKLGGLASGANRPGGNALFCGNEVYQKGLVGLSISGNIAVDAVVAQGCRPIGKPLTVTKCQANRLIELDGQPAVAALKDVLESISEHDRSLARNSLFLGVVMDEFKESFKAGDFLIRNILGIEAATGALIVGELMRNERTVQFHLRDAATSADDLRMLLKRYSDERPLGDAMGALLFSCLGRGEYLYGTPNHDSDCFKEYMGEIPLGGFFCNGEIGPVGGTTFLHGYTSSFGIFRPKTEAPR